MAKKNEPAELVRESPKLKQARSKLQAFKARKWRPVDRGVREVLERIRYQAAQQGDESLATATWILRTIADAQDEYVRAIRLMQNDHFYNGWCALEQCEQRIHELNRHFTDTSARFGVDFMRQQVGKFQALYPYGLFMSPEYIYEHVVCGLCNTPVAPRKSCGHIKGEIYGGIMCIHRIEKVKIVAVAMVTHPVQKYSVINIQDGDEDAGYNHATIEYVTKALTSPWHGWTAHKTTIRHPHEHFADRDTGGPCPCEQTDKPYSECCLCEEGVLRPHYQVELEYPPAIGTPKIQYSNPPKD